MKNPGFPIGFWAIKFRKALINPSPENADEGEDLTPLFSLNFSSRTK
jgi:hypothetical protein